MLPAKTNHIGKKQSNEGQTAVKMGNSFAWNFYSLRSFFA